MTKLFKQLGVMLFCTCYFLSAGAQQGIKIEIMVKSVYIDYRSDGGDDYGGRFRFYQTSAEDRCGYLLHSFCSDPNRRCIQTPWNNKNYSADIWQPLNSFTLAPGVTTCLIFMRTHHERQKDCISRSSDECTVENLGCGDMDSHELTTSMPINLANYTPGVWNTLGRMTNTDPYSIAYADLQIRYSVPTPVAPKPSPDASRTTYCVNEPVTLETNVAPNNTGLNYYWKYLREGDSYNMWNPDKDERDHWNEDLQECGHWEGDSSYPGAYWVWSDCSLPDSITVYNWRTFTTSTDRFMTFNPTGLLGNYVTEPLNVYFKAQAVASASGFVSPESNPLTLTFLPGPPSLNMANFSFKPSCPFPNNGQIVIPYNAISTPFSQVRWVLKTGHANDNPCSIVLNPDGSISSPCGLIEQQSNGPVNVPLSSTDPPIVIDNLPPGNYTLWVINPNENTGSCYKPMDITIGQYPVLTLDKTASANISCFGANDGTIKMQAGGGDPNSGYQFKVQTKNHPDLNTDYTTISGNVFELTGLPADEYTIYMKNACTPEISMVVTITEPVRVQGAAICNQPTCYTPANGSTAITVSQGMGNYTYQLWQDGSMVTETPFVSNTSLLFNQLLPGNYDIKVLDADRLTCPGWDTAVTLMASPVLGATLVQIDTVTCYGGSDGAVQVTGTGGTGHYIFTLNLNGTTISSNTSGTFNGLQSGSYDLVVSKPADENCNDTYTRSIDVPQRTPLVAALTVTPVTCYGMNNGSIAVQAGGGSGSYSYYWEYWNGTDWLHNPFWFSTDAAIGNLLPGKYRVQVSDNKSTADCKIVSQEATVDEPALLQIVAVQATDAACKADGGRIKITANGGNGNYLYYYSLGDKLHYTRFTENTPLTATGDYYIKVEDAKGCTVEGDKAYSISLPATPMDFTMQASDYEGTSVSCFNGNNGSITVAATGGSGSGYQYALTNGVYQTTPVFQQLAAGDYMVYVKDTRSCVLSKSISLTQPAQPLAGTIINKKEVYCPGTATGAFDIDIQFGRPPYQYSIDNGNHFQTGNTFTGLQTGTYQVIVKDKYECTWSTSVTLVSIIPTVEFFNTVKNVSCFNGNDGAVTVTAGGGQPPYQYAWQNFTNTGAQLTGLPAGKYIVHVTDGAGCLSHDTIMVAQPAAALTAATITQPVCVGSNGSITVRASGGTVPYRYSADNGSSFQTDPVLNNLPPGRYNVVVRDANNCQASYTVVIDPANAMPDINFLVASGKNALDTLVIKEVSMPIPDSVHWSFDPAAAVIETGASPRIKFNSPGNYWVSMTGYFKGCAYSLRKTVYINPYDPNAGLVYTPPVQIIDTVVLYPNPNSGSFSVHIKTNRKQKLVLMIQDMGTGREVIRRIYDAMLITDDQFALGSVSNGTYVLRVVTENDSRDVLFVINR